jgi:hypothetical protein
MAAVSEAGIGFEVVRMWADVDRPEERRLKELEERPAALPVCSGRKAA